MVKRGRTKTGSVQQTTTFQYLLLLIFLTVLNISFFFGHGISFSYMQCSTDIVFETLTSYISGYGSPPLEAYIPQQCSKPSDQVMLKFSNSIRNIITDCYLEQQRNKKFKSSQPIVTLFTTFADHIHSDAEKEIVHNNTIVNWAKLRPMVNLILFANDSHWSRVAQRHGWDVIQPKADETITKRPPVLKDMFSSAMSRHKTTWYGYVNADVLFTSGLVSHLETLTRDYNASTRSIMLTGRRTNVDKLSQIDPLSDENLIEIAAAYGSLYKEDAEDFFITTNSFPWQQVLPVVVGRPAYDNWLVAEARCRLNANVIDVTDTLLALHQTTIKGGNNEGHRHEESDLNLKIFKENNQVPNFLSGLTSCIPYRTYATFCDTIGVHKRSDFNKKCECGS